MAVEGFQGAFTILYGLGSVKIKQIWYLGEALPALLVGILLGPIAAKFIDSERWGSAVEDQTADITLVRLKLIRLHQGMTRVVIGIQLVMAGYQLPAKYPWHRWRDMALLLIPVMTIMWLCTTGCIKLMVPKLTTLTAMVIASLVTWTDPAGSNDGFGFPFLLLATYLIRHTPEEDVNFKPGVARIAARAGDVGRLGGGAGQAVEIWIVEGWLYFILTGTIVGAVAGIGSMYAVNYALKRKWIDSESLLLYPIALGLFIIGTTGCAGLDDLLACFCAGAAFNWNGKYLNETLQRHGEVNSSIDILLNFRGFMYIGAILPWGEFNWPDITGITYGLVAGGAVHGVLGPIGIGAVFYVEHARHLFPKVDAAETHEEEDLLHAMGLIVYFLVLFSIVVHGLSIPALELIYRWQGVQPIVEVEPVTERALSVSSALPNNAHIDHMNGGVIRHNRFSRAVSRDGAGFSFEDVEKRYGVSERHMSKSQPPPETPIWRLTAATDGSDDTLKDGNNELQRDKSRVSFVEETLIRGWQRNASSAPYPSAVKADNVAKF
ncbi:hypothetical protein GQ44DRAFT_823163 [Phaeosphaeriaceae sp. PMI808]|nr:hypothetical protein GQ44DRAFT_823163 [Phaeosphaeriaceae sp. PMI808]